MNHLDRPPQGVQSSSEGRILRARAPWAHSGTGRAGCEAGDGKDVPRASDLVVSQVELCRSYGVPGFQFFSLPFLSDELATALTGGRSGISPRPAAVAGERAVMPAGAPEHPRGQCVSHSLTGSARPEKAKSVPSPGSNFTVKSHCLLS